MKTTKAQLRHKIMELEAQLASTYHFADADIHKAQDLMGSGVLIRMHGLGGKELVLPFVIRDGLSPETITTLRADIRRSYEVATAFKPKGA